MKKLTLLTCLALLGLQVKSQVSATVAIQFYVDANNDCTYNPGEQIVYNIPASLTYAMTNTTSTQITFNTTSVSVCGGYTLLLYNSSSTAINTLSLLNNSGVSPNTSCNNYNNIPYNTNTINYLPVTLTGTSNIGVNVSSWNYYSSSGSYSLINLSSGSNTMGVCSNIGNDSINLNFTINNYFTCNPTGMSPRTYSFFLNGINYDVITATGGFPAYNNLTGLNNMSKMNEQYLSSQTYINMTPKLPSTFTALGSHTFMVKSSNIYNNPQSSISFSCILNSIPCTKISGKFFNDCNNNCVYDASDNFNIGWFAAGKIYNSSGFDLNFYPNAYTGAFSLYLPTTVAYSITSQPLFSSGPFSFTACSTATTTIPIAATTTTFMYGFKNNSSSITNPGVTFNRINSTSPIISPGVGVTFGVGFYNNWWNVCSSTSANSGKLKVSLPKFINYVGPVSGPTPTVITSGISADTLVWAVPNFSNIANWWSIGFATFSAVVNLTAVPGTPFLINAQITPSIDINLNNNTLNFNRVIGGPFDPNGKYTEASGLMSNGDVPYANSKQFYYTIGFQNIGNAPAINVKTVDTIDVVNFDINTFEVISSSYPVNAQVDKNTGLVVFHFEGINLPGAITNEPKSHGFVKYGIKIKNGIPVNTILKNRAHNYFDFNEPIATNQTINKLVVSTGLDAFGNIENKVKAVPNPTSNKLKIESESGLIGIQVYDLSGRLLMVKTNGEYELDFENLPAAIYLVKVQGLDNSLTTIKVIKE